MTGLRSFLVGARTAGRPFVGVCVGDQIMADTFGGRADLAPLGVIAGMRQFEIQGQRFDAHVWHRDQVVMVPPEARVIGSADYCPNAVLRYDFPAFSCQMHPEYSADWMRAAFDAVSAAELTPAQKRQAHQTVNDGKVDPWLLANTAAAVLRDARPS